MQCRRLWVNSRVRKIPWRMDRLPTPVFLGFPGGSDGELSACSAGVPGSIPGLGRSPGGGHGNPHQYSCLENPHGQRSLAGYSPWDRRVRNNWVTKCTYIFTFGFPWWLSGKDSSWEAGDTGSIHGSERPPEERNGNHLHYSYLENPMDRGAWQAIVHGVAKSQTQLND